MPGVSPDHARLIHQLETIARLTDQDRALLATLPLRVKSFPRNPDNIREGDRPTDSCVVLDGVVCRYKLVAAGRRQIVCFHFSGDLPDLQSLHLGVMDHALAAITPARVAFIPHEAIRNLIDDHERVRDILYRHALVDGSLFREWVANVGRRSAPQRIAHVICECYVRMQALGLAELDSFELPLTQTELGDATGLSNVHINRVLQTLRRQNLIRSDGINHGIVDWDRLQEVADFRPAYLHILPSALP